MTADEPATGGRAATAAEPLRIGMIGCGNIARQYLDSLARLPNLRQSAVADRIPAAAERVAAEQGVPARTVDELLADPEIEAVLNLTTPQAHAPITIAALQAGKHVYQEKPFAVTVDEADAMLTAARDSGRRLGAAPDTVLGTGIQTARRLVDDGVIGTPVGATAFMLNPGHESWHPDPAFYYAAGGGPLLDMGVYYLTALVTLLGPVAAVSSMGSRTRSRRVVPDGAPRAGEVLAVEVDTYTAALIRHVNGAISTLVVSFDVASTVLPPIELYGTAATVAVPDPNRFADPVSVGRRRREPFEPVDELAGYRDAGRGYGLADLARAARAGGPHRQSAELGYHVNEVMARIQQASGTGDTVEVISRCERPAPVTLGSTPDQA